MRWKNGAKILCAHCNIHVCKRISFPTPFSIARHTHKHTHFEWKSERVVARIYAKNIGREISNPNTYIMYKWLRWFYFLVFRRSFANLFFRFVSNKKMEKTRTRTCTYTHDTPTHSECETRKMRRKRKKIDKMWCAHNDAHQTKCQPEPRMKKHITKSSHRRRNRNSECGNNKKKTKWKTHNEYVHRKGGAFSFLQTEVIFRLCAQWKMTAIKRVVSFCHIHVELFPVFFFCICVLDCERIYGCAVTAAVVVCRHRYIALDFILQLDDCVKYIRVSLYHGACIAQPHQRIDVQMCGSNGLGNKMRVRRYERTNEGKKLWNSKQHTRHNPWQQNAYRVETVLCVHATCACILGSERRQKCMCCLRCYVRTDLMRSWMEWCVVAAAAAATAAVKGTSASVRVFTIHAICQKRQAYMIRARVSSMDAIAKRTRKNSSTNSEWNWRDVEKNRSKFERYRVFPRILHVFDECMLRNSIYFPNSNRRFY